MKIKSTESTGTTPSESRHQNPQRPAHLSAGQTKSSPGFTLKEILVPVDFTDCTEKALSYAVPFAQQFDAVLTLLHVVEPPYVPATEMGVMIDLDDNNDANRELERLRDKLADQVRCRTLIRNGSAESEIIGVARELHSDLIILSTHGRTGVERLLLGSTAEKVVRRAGCPLFVVRPHEHDFVAGTPADWDADKELEQEIEAEMKAGV